MELENEVFGKLVFDYTWSKEEQFLFFGKEENVVLLVAGDEDGEFEDGQYDAYKTLKTKWSDIQESLLEAIMEYYKNKREELGYDVEQNEKYPEMLTVDDLLEHITFVGVKVPYAELYGGRSIGLSFDCTWDEENGVGVRLSDECVVRVGYQDIAI